MPGTRWNVVVSSDTDKSLRDFLAESGAEGMGLSRFVEEAVQSHLFELSSRQVKAQNAGISEKRMDNVIDEALVWARRG